jgi:uracil-DNA glycosylase
MGFCYPGKGKTGGYAPPRKECAPKWHDSILKEIKKYKLVETVRSFEEYYHEYFSIVHPSPLNFIWHTKNTWFKLDVGPILQLKVKEILSKYKAILKYYIYSIS